MATVLTVTVSDVNGAALQLAGIRVIFSATDTAPALTVKEIKPGESLSASLALPEVEVSVSAPNFEGETFYFSGSGGNWQTNNPASAITKAGDNLRISITLGIVRLAPGLSVPEDQKLVDKNPGAVFVASVSGGEWIYRSVFQVPI